MPQNSLQKWIPRLIILNNDGLYWCLSPVGGPTSIQALTVASEDTSATCRPSWSTWYHTMGYEGHLQYFGHDALTQPIGHLAR